MAAHSTRVILDSHPEWVALRDRALRYARGNMETPRPDWNRQLTCMPGLGVIWEWDSCFMAFYAGYTPEGLHGLGNLDNLYSVQREDGYISMAYLVETGEPIYGERVNPPLCAWSEWCYARRTGDVSRLPRAYPVLVRFYDWLKANRRRENGLYYFEDTGSSGMDNSPRSGYSAHDLKGSDVCFVDLACQQVLAARCLSEMARSLGKEKEADAHREEAEGLADLINKLHWSDRTGFYHDLFCNTNNKLANKTIAAFWAMIAGVAKGERLETLVAHLSNPATFGGCYHPVPTLSRDDPNFRPHGGYWLGSTWAPTNYMVVRGLRENGYRELARQIAARHLEVMTEVANGQFDSIWECYSPDEAAPATTPQGLMCRPDFVGWSGLGPIVMLVEDILGLDLRGIENALTWRLRERGRQGIEDFPFHGGTISLIADVAEDDAFTVEIESDQPVRGEIHYPQSTRPIAFDFPAGKHHLSSR